MSISDNMQRINLELPRKGSSAQNMDPAASAIENDSYSSEIEKAQRMLEELRQKKEEQQREQQRALLIQGKRDEFSGFRDEVIEKLTTALPRIDEELHGAKQEISDLEQAKKHFQSTLQSVESINPDQWRDDDVLSQADKFLPSLSKAARDYEQFSLILSEGRGGSSIQKMTSKAFAPVNGFWGDVLRGFAFSLPLIFALTILLLIFSKNG